MDSIYRCFALFQETSFQKEGFSFSIGTLEFSD